MIDASGGLANFIAILIPALMGGFYGYRCLFLTHGFIAQYGLGAGSEFMVKLSGTYTFTQSLIYIILLLTSPAGAWSVSLPLERSKRPCSLCLGILTVKGKWAQVEGCQGDS